MKDEAERLGISLAVLLRRSLRPLLPPEPGQPPWMRYAPMMESGDQAASRHSDELVYGYKD